MLIVHQQNATKKHYVLLDYEFTPVQLIVYQLNKHNNRDSVIIKKHHGLTPKVKQILEDLINQQGISIPKKIEIKLKSKNLNSFLAKFTI